MFAWDQAQHVAFQTISASDELSVFMTKADVRFIDCNGVTSFQVAISDNEATFFFILPKLQTVDDE